MKSSDATLTCPICEDGQLELRTHTATIQHNGEPLVIEEMEYCECPVCGSDPVLVDQISRNELRVADAKRAAMGMLTSEDIRLVRRMLGITQREASGLFGGGANSFSKYERGVTLQSSSMDMLLKLLALRPDLLGLAGRLKGRSLEECYLQYDWLEVPSDVVEASVDMDVWRLPHQESDWSDAA